MHAFLKARLLVLAARAGEENIPPDSLIGAIQQMPDEDANARLDIEDHIDVVPEEKK